MSSFGNHHVEQYEPELPGIHRYDCDTLRSAQNRKEIIMDNSAFYGGQRERLADLENDRYQNVFLFHQCSSNVCIGTSFDS